MTTPPFDPGNNPPTTDDMPPLPQAPFDPSQLTFDDVPMPDHTASADPDPAPGPEPGNTDGTPFRLIPGGRKGKGDKPPKVKREREIPRKRPGQLVKPLTDLYASMGAVVSAVDPVCGLTIVENAEKCAESLDALAQRNEAVRRALYAMMETSAWGGVMVAHLPLLAVVMMHHGPRDVAERFAPIAAFVAPNAVANMQSEAEPTPAPQHSTEAGV